MLPKDEIRLRQIIGYVFNRRRAAIAVRISDESGDALYDRYYRGADALRDFCNIREIDPEPIIDWIEWAAEMGFENVD